MASNRLDGCFMRLVRNLKQNTQKKMEPITLMIGAGCSLTSSSKNITTYGIIESLVRQHSLKDNIPTTWTDLYQAFVNDVWEGQGERNRIQLLEDFFTDMTPSAGYQAMRWLVENGYIDNILTTNFDLMIDKVLEGLSYRLVVGSHEEIVGPEPKPVVTIIKAHGDLIHGELRFAPDELTKLPDKLSQEIYALTTGTVLVVGYRGQDIGLLNSLDNSGNYNAYWAAPERPDPMDVYETKPVYTWMEKRHSKNNFLYGDAYGTFDKLLTQLKLTLIQLSERDKLQRVSRFNKLWEKSPFLDYLRLNKRFLQIFEQLHCYLDAEVQEDMWRVTEPYCAQHYEVLLKSILDLMQENAMSSGYMDCVGNEVDALVFTLSCSIWTLCQGYPRIPQDLVKKIREKFEVENDETRIGDKFWGAVLQLSCTSLTDGDNYLCVDEPLSFYFDKGENLQTVLMHIELQEMHDLLSDISALLLFAPTCSNNSEFLTAQKTKETLEKHLYERRCYNNLIRLQMSQITLSTYQELYSMLRKYGFSETVIGDEYTLSRNSIRVSFPVKKALPNQKTNIWEILTQQAQVHREEFLQESEPQQFVQRQHMCVFSDFLRSPSNGFFVIGDSGSGKTTTLKLWLKELDTTEYLVYPILGRDKQGQEAKRALEGVDQQIRYVEIMLEQRNQSLLIIFDAINEMRGTFADIASFYKELLKFCDKLSREECARIKVVISCRNDFYAQLKKSSGVEPLSASFYTVDTSAEPQAFYQLPLLNEEEIGGFVRLYRSAQKNVTVEELYQEFGELIYLPINLNIICNAYGVNGDGLTNGGDYTSIYEKWFGQLAAAATKDAIYEETLWAVVFWTIQNSFFERNGGEVQTHRLFADLSAQHPGAPAAFEWLVLHRVFRRSDQNPNLIQFSHDRLEEYFFSQYILKKYKNQLDALDRILVDESLTWPVVRHGLTAALLTLFQNDRLLFITPLVRIVQDSNDPLLSLWVDAILQITKKMPMSVSPFLRELEQYLLKREFNAFMQAMLLQMRQMLDDMTDVGREVVDTIAGVVLQSNARENATLEVLCYYLRARQRYLFPDEDDTQAFRTSLALCQQVDSRLSKAIPVSLKDEHQTLEALLLQNQGQLNEAIDLMEQCYKRQSESVMYDLACQSALYLGAMYREMTRFDDAITLYDTVKTDMVSSPLLRFRLSMNKGIIYKNKIQNALFSGQGATEENLGYYRHALENFKQTCDYADQSEDIKLQLEIYAERVELGCVAYYLDLGTIREAISWVERMDALIPRYHVPVVRIQRHRMWARVLVLESKFEQAIEHLERGFQIAVDFNIPFRATDCCNQITGTICSALNIESILTREMLDRGLRYGEYAINYYEQLKQSNHRYLQDSKEKYQRIQRARQAIDSKA